MFITDDRSWATGRKVGGYWGSASPAWRFEQGGDLSDGFGAWADVPHRGARVAVPGLGHDQLQGDALFAEVGGRGVAELVQLPPGVMGEQDPGAVVAEPGPPGDRAQVPGGGTAGGAGRRSDRNTAPAWRPRMRGGSRCAVPDPQQIHSVSPPL